MADATNPYAPVSDTNTDVAPDAIPHLDAPQSVRYRFSAELLTAFWTHRTLHSPGDNRVRRRVAYRLVLSGVVTLSAVGLMVLGDLIHAWALLPATIFLMVLAFLAFQSRRPSAIQLAYAQTANRLLDESPNTHLLSERTVTLEADGIRQTLPYSDSFTRWEAYERVDYNDDYLFLYESSFTAVVVPRTAFATREQYLGFVHLAERLRTASAPPARGGAS